MRLVASDAFAVLESVMKPPKLVRFRDAPAFRFVAKTPEQMIFLKFARVVSGLHALDVLISAGFIQELGVIMRTLDEAEEDIQCIALAIINDKWSELQKRLMEYFWQEEFSDGIDPVRSLPRGMVDRKKVRAWIVRNGGINNTSIADEAGRTVYKSMSGFVHAAASHVMDLYTGSPMHFAVGGVRDERMLAGYVELVIDYMYRGMMVSYFVIKSTLGHDAAQPFYERIKSIEIKMSDRLFPASPPVL